MLFLVWLSKPQTTIERFWNKKMTVEINFKCNWKNSKINIIEWKMIFSLQNVKYWTISMDCEPNWHDNEFDRNDSKIKSATYRQLQHERKKQQMELQKKKNALQTLLKLLKQIPKNLSTQFWKARWICTKFLILEIVQYVRKNNAECFFLLCPLDMASCWLLISFNFPSHITKVD